MHKKAYLKLLAPAVLIALIFLAACSEEEITRVDYQYNVRYEVISYMDTASSMFITYSDPDIANQVSEYLENVRHWKYEFKGYSLDRCFIEAMVVEDSANLSVKIFVDSVLMSSDSTACLSPIVCDTNIVVADFSLQ